MEKIQIIYHELKDGSILVNDIWNYISKPGVWALYGNKHSKYVCLNVGKSKDVGREILYDLSCLHHLPSDKKGSQKYINQFGEDQNFSCESGWTQEYLYPRLNEYDEMVFIYIYDKSCSEHEKRFAWITRAKYWRNGKAFENVRPNYYVDNKEEYLNGKEEIYGVDSLDDILVKLMEFDW